MVLSRTGRVGVLAMKPAQLVIVIAYENAVIHLSIADITVTQLKVSKHKKSNGNNARVHYVFVSLINSDIQNVRVR